MNKMEAHDYGAVHDDFLRMFKENGLQELATECGIVKNGEIPTLKSAEKGRTRLPQGSSSKRKLSQSAKGSNGVSDRKPEGGSKPKKKRITRAGGDKCNKGLRHSSMKVLRKVEEKGRTTYNEVADELVEEYTANKGLNEMDQSYEGKNIRRRVYDILNVLIAMDIISRDKKEIKWRGLPSNAERDLEMLQRERQAVCKSIEEKQEHLQELLMQQVALKNLIKRNAALEKRGPVAEDQRIPLPFIVINTNKDTIVECEMAENQTDIFFNFNNTFEIHDDNEILKRMKLQSVPPGELKEYVPEALMKYLPAHVRGEESYETNILAGSQASANTSKQDDSKGS